MSAAEAGEDGRLPSELEDHFDVVVRGLRRGMVTPLLGAGASLFGRREEVAWNGAPTGAELAARLAREFGADEEELIRVAQRIYALKGGTGQLYRELHDIFDCDFPLTELHRFIAGIPKRLEAHNVGKPLLIVTTNYDDLIERALAREDIDDAEERARAKVDYDLLVYMADGPDEGRFCHRPPGGALSAITDPPRCTVVDPDERTVVLKLHGFVSRDDDKQDSYVITEDHYIEYLTRTDLTERLPPAVVNRLLDCHLLFLGYSLRDWNLRAILYGLYRRRLRDNDWWAVMRGVDAVERKSWQNRDVDIFDVPLERYLAGLAAALDASFEAPGPPAKARP